MKFGHGGVTIFKCIKGKLHFSALCKFSKFHWKGFAYGPYSKITLAELACCPG